MRGQLAGQGVKKARLEIHVGVTQKNKLSRRREDALVTPVAAAKPNRAVFYNGDPNAVPAQSVNRALKVLRQFVPRCNDCGYCWHCAASLACAV